MEGATYLLRRAVCGNVTAFDDDQPTPPTRMKLLFVHERFGAHGGAEANIAVVAAEFKRRGHAIALLHGDGTGKQEQEWRDLFPLRHKLPGNDDTDAALRIGDALQSVDPDLIYVHRLNGLELTEALVASGRPVVRMVHDHDLYCMRSYRYNVFSRRICDRALSPYCIFPCGGSVARNRDGGFPLKLVSYEAKRRELELHRRFAKLIVATRYMREQLAINGIAAERVEIHAPVPANPDLPLRSSFDERNRLVFAGQLIRGKGVDVLLETLALVEQPFECEILGDGSHREYCEELCRKLGLADRVRFHGFVPQEKILDFYSHCSVAVMSSLWPEPFGAVGLEAMRHGLPVIAFDAGGIREWLMDGWNGFLVPWMDRRRFAARVDELLRDKALARKLGERGRYWVRVHYGFSEYVDGLERLFTRVAADSTSCLASA
jgi:glycosyltransferase involved in cell wall biosynthesis